MEKLNDARKNDLKTNRIEQMQNENLLHRFIYY